MNQGNRPCLLLVNISFQVGGEEAPTIDQGPAEVTLQHAQSMEAISVADQSQIAEDISKLMKKIDYDPYNDDEVITVKVC